MKSHLVKATFPDVNEIGRCKPCGGKRPPCQLCSNMKNTGTFESKHSNEVYQIMKNFNCNFKMVVYLIECSICRKQYNGSTVTKFRTTANNYKSIHRITRKEQKLSHQARKPKHFHEHYLQNGWGITILDHSETEKSLSQIKIAQVP